MKTSLLVLFSFLSIQCQNLYEAQNPFKHHKRDRQFFEKLTNNDTNSQNVILTNSEYPFEIKLVKDGSFQYKLEKLGTGEGSWKYEDGFVTLYAERKRFIMNMELHNIDLKSDATSLVFADRFGYNFLPMKVVRQ